MVYILLELHMSIEEALVYGRRNPDIDNCVIRNECADAAAEAEVDGQGRHDQ